VSFPVPLELPLELLELIESFRSALIYIVVTAGIFSGSRRRSGGWLLIAGRVAGVSV
jgi:hypothetical protein